MRNLFGILFVLLLVCSCADDPGNRTPDAYPVRFTSGLSGEVLSRVVDDNWETGDPVGIYMFPATAYHLGSADFSDTKLVPNMRYRISTGGSSEGVLEPDGSTNTLYYPIAGNVNFVAYYPYKADIYTTNGNIYQVNVEDQSSLPAIDLLYHRDKPDTEGGSVPVYNRNSGSVPMKFYHQLSKMKINIASFYDDTEGLDWENATVELRGFPTTAEFDLSTGVLDNLVVDFTTPLILRSLTNTNESGFPDNQADFEAIVVPHSNDESEGGNTYERTVTLRIKLDEIEKTYIHVLSGSNDFEPGKAYQYNYQIVGGVLKLVSSTIDNWDEGAVHGGNYSLLASRLSFDLSYTSTSGNTVTIMTNAGVPAFTLSKEANNNTTEQPSWITGTSLSAGIADTGMGEGWMKYILTFDTDPNDGQKRTGYIRVGVAGLSLAICVTQEAEEANSFIVTPGNTLEFYPGRAFNEGGADLDVPLSVDILWADTQDCIHNLNISGTGNTSVVTVTAGSSPGNALIAVKDGGGVICWSYHIWVTDYNPDQGGATYTNTYNTNNDGSHFVFMDRHLGAIRAGLGSGLGKDMDTGLFYQWGRKDPFPVDFDGLDFGDIISEKVSDQVSIRYTISNPNKYIWISHFIENEGDWYWGSRNDELWGHSGDKTVYDPCPAGWRVPKNYDPVTPQYASDNASPWAGFTLDGAVCSTKGLSWGDHAVYPANGSRNMSDNYVYDGNNSSVWSASPGREYNGSCASSMFFRYTESTPWGESLSVNTDSSRRACGFAVRCVRE